MKKAETGGKQGQTVANTGNVRPNVHLGSFGKRHSSEPYPQRFQDSRLGREGAEDQRKMTTMRQTDTPDRKTEQAEHVENTTAQILAEKMGPSPARWRRGGASELLIVAQNPGQKGHSRGQNQAHVSLASLQRKKKKKRQAVANRLVSIPSNYYSPWGTGDRRSHTQPTLPHPQQPLWRVRHSSRQGRVAPFYRDSQRLRQKDGRAGGQGLSCEERFRAVEPGKVGVEETQCLSSPGGGAKNQRCSNHSNKSCH